MSAPLLVMLAGPNGAGKSTFFEANLRGLELPFLNADRLARETGMGAYEAARTIAAASVCNHRKPFEHSPTRILASFPQSLDKDVRKLPVDR